MKKVIRAWMFFGKYGYGRFWFMDKSAAKDQIVSFPNMELVEVEICPITPKRRRG